MKRAALQISTAIGSCLLMALTAASQARMGLPAPEKVELRSTEVSVPMELFGNRPVVDVSINGKGPYKFILDTGAAGTILAQSLADELKLQSLGEIRVGSPIGGQSQPGKLVKVNQLEMGQASILGFQCVAMDLEQLFSDPSAPRGILSAALFSGYLLTLDYPGARIILKAGQLPPANASDVFEYDPAQRLPMIKISVAGTDIEAHVDSGSPRGIVLPKTYAEKLPLATKLIEAGKGRTVDAEFLILKAKLNGTIKLGRYTLDTADIFFSEAAPVGNIGYDVLRGFALTFDRKNHRIQFEERSGSPVTTSVRPRAQRYGIRFRGFDETPLKVVDVDSGSPADLSGVRPDDLIVEMAGSPIEKLTVSERIQKLKSSPLVIRLQREGKVIEVTMSLE
jgi:hypothetical protein